MSAGTARRLAADAHLIPAVSGGRGEVLDLGRKQRLFSPAQKLAFAERDDGCAWGGCPHPPAYTHAHHIRWWDRDTGRTDLDNGILLARTITTGPTTSGARVKTASHSARWASSRSPLGH
ncbi:MAG TPA: hypothetical protein VGI08_09180 [Diaminobutyricibacter sp.]